MPVLPNEPLLTPHLTYLRQIQTRSRLIYCVTLLATFIAIAVLPFLYTAVSIKGRGLMQSRLEKAPLLAPISGRVVQINLRDNQKVIKGTPLLRIDTTLARQQIELLDYRRLQLQRQLKDVRILIARVTQKPTGRNESLKTGLYRANWQQYTEQWHYESNARARAQHIYLRYQVLYNKRVVTLAEFEQYKFNYEQALSNQFMVNKKYHEQWQTEASQYGNELLDLQNQMLQLNDQGKQYTLKATLTGSVQNLVGIQVGSYVLAGQKLGEISPDSAILAYCYINPANIGLIKKGQSVSLQMDAFNFNQWGVVNGHVVEVSDDTIFQNQMPYFKVKCRLDKSYLQLKNGYKVFLKKGMTFNANFIIAKRSLYQLLYDNVADWVSSSGAQI
ncbi:MAG: HlyD family efflux transporter periplasmic adaptor subunit [Bacteroidota bacterium]